MRRSLTVLVLLVAATVQADEALYKGVKVKSLADSVKKDSSSKADTTKSKQPVAQERQDTYGAPAAPSVDTYGSPQAPAVDSYGSPQAPVQDSYGSPQADPVAPAPVQGEVGTQGYYYYYYPVANGYSPTQTYQSHSPSSSSGGLSGSNLGILIFVGLGILVVIALVASFATNSGTGRSLMDVDELAYKVYEAIELWNTIRA